MMTSGDVLLLQGYAFLISALQGGERSTSNSGLCIPNNNSYASVWASESPGRRTVVFIPESNHYIDCSEKYGSVLDFLCVCVCPCIIAYA